MIASHLRILIVTLISVVSFSSAAFLALRLLPVVDASVSAENLPVTAHEPTQTVTTTSVTVFATTETTPTVLSAELLSETITGTLPGFADGPVIWTHPLTPALSTLVATLQDGGLAVFDLTGNLVQHITVTTGTVRYHGIDLLGGFVLEGDETDLIVVADGENDVPAFFRIDPVSRFITDVTSTSLMTTTFAVDDGDHTAYGLATYTEPLSGTVYAFVTQRNGNLVAQLELFDDGTGVAVTTTRLITLPLPTDIPADSQARGIVADSDTGFVYVAMATHGGLLKLTADPDVTPTMTMVHAITDSAFLMPDLGGLALYSGPDNAGYLLLSSRGNDSFAVLERSGDNAFVGSFVISDSGAIDAVTGTIGIVASSEALDEVFPHGVVAVQDSGDDSAESATNFKLIAWENIACAFANPLLIASDGPSPCKKKHHLPLVLNSTASPPTGVVISTKHSFDTCVAPDVGTMQVWWNNSPYYDANIYLGGAARACAQPHLDANWVFAVVNQGWNLIPTWVGPQAPCSIYGTKMSGDPVMARTEGRTNADEAIVVSAALDLTNFGAQTIVYYDIEPYDTADSGCHAAVAAFLDGWVERLHELGHRAGVYGLSATAASWASHANPPDDVWVANWIYNSYTPEATVWNVYGLPDDLWTEHQRIRQYTGGHLETWGGVTINIDSNVADGHVVGVNERLEVAPAHVQHTAFTAPGVVEMEMVAPGTGWMLRNGRMLWSADNGTSWHEITPNHDGRVLTVDFSDVQHGWAVVQRNDGLALFRSADSGSHWSSVPLAVDIPAGMVVDSAELDFETTQLGWLYLQLASGSNFAPSIVLNTIDGGSNWHTVPGALHRFADDAALPANAPDHAVAVTAYGATSWVQITDGQCTGKRPDASEPLVCSVASRFLRSADGGQSWLIFEP
ncbi:MAG: phytase [Anaerolineae bacterium]|nr:phytase [Anaerolineae bacterium]